MGNRGSKLSNDDLDELRKATGLDNDMIKGWRVDFLRWCPNGQLSLQDFRRLYGEHFSFGDLELVFRRMDENKDGKVDFKELMVGLCITHRSGLDKKLAWTYEVYDSNGNGVLEYSELISFVTSIDKVYGPLGNASPAELVTEIYRNINKREGSNLNVKEFKEGIQSCPVICKVLTRNDGLLEKK